MSKVIAPFLYAHQQSMLQLFHILIVHYLTKFIHGYVPSFIEFTVFTSCFLEQFCEIKKGITSEKIKAQNLSNSKSLH